MKQVLILILFFFAACNYHNKFEIPKINQELFSNKKKNFKVDQVIESVGTIIYSKFQINDNVDLAKNVSPIDSNDIFYDNSLNNKFKNLGRDGLQIIVDYSQDVHHIVKDDKYRFFTDDVPIYNTFPVFILNETSKPKLLEGKNNYIYAIQEAKDRNGYWRPIERRGIDMCGNGSWDLLINSKEFVIALFPRYDGNYNTEMRIRLKNKENISISPSFYGKIDLNQFKLDSLEYIKLNSDHRRIYDEYYGATPQGYSKLDEILGIRQAK